MNPGLPLFPIGGDVDQFQVPRIMPGTPTRQLRIAETDMSNQYNHQRLDSHDQPPQQLPLTPMHGPPASQQSPLEQSPVYGQITDLPHYELMIVKALEAINDPNGSPPKSIWEWMNNNYPCNPKFRASASQALQKALKKGRLLKTGSLYKVNPDFNPIHPVPFPLRDVLIKLGKSKGNTKTSNG
jgi:linker histone H1 and H5 family